MRRAAVISRQGRRLLVVELKENARAIAISLQESLARACIEKVAACQKIPVDKRPNANMKSENTCYISAGGKHHPWGSYLFVAKLYGFHIK